ncbi:hypothetical protein F3D3_3926 [Fusibacter sp. 3D3]|nr:hypothetical protein F3D3_3926 [Fusibacter sp. 3D3]
MEVTSQGLWTSLAELVGFSLEKIKHSISRVLYSNAIYMGQL